MTWQKKGLVYKPDGSKSFSRTHAQVPFGYAYAGQSAGVFFHA